MKLVGYIDGIEVNFDFYPPHTFKCTIPKTINGRYIVQLKAVDDAGNETNLTKIYVYIDFKKMDFVILDKIFTFNIDNSDFDYLKIDNLYDFKQLEERFNFMEVNSQYSYRELVTS